MCGPTFSLKNHNNSNSRNKIIKNILQSLTFLYPYTGKFCIALYISKFAAESLKWMVLGASSLEANFVELPQASKKKTTTVEVKLTSVHPANFSLHSH